MWDRFRCKGMNTRVSSMTDGIRPSTAVLLLRLGNCQPLEVIYCGQSLREPSG